MVKTLCWLVEAKNKYRQWPIPTLPKQAVTGHPGLPICHLRALLFRPLGDDHEIVISLHPFSSAPFSSFFVHPYPSMYICIHLRRPRARRVGPESVQARKLSSPSPESRSKSQGSSSISTEAREGKPNVVESEIRSTIGMCTGMCIRLGRPPVKPKKEK